MQTLRIKKSALAAAKAEVTLLETQIAKISELLSISFEESAFEKLQKAEKPTATPAAVNPMQNPFLSASSPEFAPLFTPESHRVRNRKGSVRAAILSALTATRGTTLDEIEDAIKAQVSKPVTRPSLRTQMMNLKRDGIVTSEANGVFRLASKGETPAGTGVSGATMSATDEP